MCHFDFATVRRTFVGCSLCLLFAVPSYAITIPTVPVGDVGNSSDPANGNLYGNVNSLYRIGTYEVTIGQYTAMLNAVAAFDPYGLYNPNMTDPNIAGIARSGASGSFMYSVIGSPNRPITYVSWGDAARFANWLHNNQPTGGEGPGTTETGAYTMNGATNLAALMAITRNADAQWYIPTENQWYKAAYYQPAASGGDADGYWGFAMRTNSGAYSDQPPGATPDNTRVGNFYANDGLANGYDDGYAVTGSGSYNSTLNYLTDVGAYTLSPSYYGTFDQEGNVAEWTETVATSTSRLVRGGTWYYGVSNAEIRNVSVGPTDETSLIGFRVANITPQASLTGDYNGDGRVDAADYVVWRKTDGTPAGYNTWRAHFGQTAGSGSGADFANVAIPEPTTLLMLISGIFANISRRRTAVTPRRIGRITPTCWSSLISLQSDARTAAGTDL